MCLYESAMIRQGRAMKAMAAAWGGGGGDDPEPSYSARLREEKGEKKEKKKSYLPSWAIDPKQGGEVTPAYGEKEVSSLPINLGYSIIDNEG